jgi:CheY-like chemotaxis protein
MPGRSLHILLVEDNDVDAELIVREFQQQGGQQIITLARDGIEALERLRGLPGHAKLVQPYLIITEIDMPRMNGLEFLRELRQDPQLRQSVVFVLTRSALEEDKLAAYEQQIAGYLLKAKVLANFSLMVNLVRCYQEHVEFPP